MTRGFQLKKPDKTRRTFQVIPYRRLNGKKVYDRPLESPELAALNESFKNGTLTAAQVEVEIKQRLLKELRRREGIPEKLAADSMVSEHNLKVFKEFWNKEYRRKKLELPDTARHEFIAALQILEPLSLHTCDVDDLQDHWDKKEKGTRHKRYGNRINQLLKYLNRGFELHTDRAVTPPLQWVTWDELERILEKVKDEQLKDLYRSLYGTGARLGEMLAITEEDVRANGTAYICKQIDSTKRLKPYTKNKKSHDTVVLDEALPALKRWAKVKDKAALRSRCQHPLINAAVEVFKQDSVKQISPHKLRHSYVKQMTLLGVPLDKIAQYLGDRVSTVETTYRQWTVVDAEISYVRSIMKEGYERLKKGNK